LIRPDINGCARISIATHRIILGRLNSSENKHNLWLRRSR